MASPPCLIAVIADEGHLLTGELTKQIESADKAIGDYCLAGSADAFQTKLGAEGLSKIEVLVLGVFAGGNPQVIVDLWPQCPKVRWIHSLAAGVDTLVPALRSLPRIEQVPITNAKGAFSWSLAEYCLMAMLHFNKQVPRIQENKRQKKWEKFTMRELHGKTVGFVGFGDIAQTTANVCRPLGMKILALRRRTSAGGAKAEADETYGIQDEGERLQLFSKSDFVICSLPGSPETKHFCGAKEFKAMKSSGIFISIGRGMCVDEAALTEALKSEEIAGAALDVYETEPLPEQSPLWDAPNLLMTSHNADLVDSYFADSWKVFIQNLQALRSAPDSFKGTVSLDLGY